MSAAFANHIPLARPIAIFAFLMGLSVSPYNDRTRTRSGHDHVHERMGEVKAVTFEAIEFELVARQIDLVVTTHRPSSSGVLSIRCLCMIAFQSDGTAMPAHTRHSLASIASGHLIPIQDAECVHPALVLHHGRRHPRGTVATTDPASD